MTLPSGLISATSMDHSLLEKWTSSLPDSRASHIQSQDTDKAKQIREIYGLKRGELYLRYDQSGSCWRTYQASMFDLTMDGQHMGALYSENFPSSGMIVSGQLYRLPTQAHPISANDGGSRHIPTPSASDGYIQDLNSTQQKPDTFKSLNLPDYTTRYPDNGSGLWPTPRVSDTEGGIVQNVEYENGSFSRLNADGVRWGVKLKDAVNHVEKQQWPTPRARDYKDGASTNSYNYGMTLGRAAATWPTPTASPSGMYAESDETTEKRPKSDNFITLARAVNHLEKQQWPTPTAREGKDGTAEACKNVPTNGLLGRTIHEGQNQPTAALNPDWVEWLMGVPIGWSSPEPLPEGAWEEWITDITAGTWWDTERDIPRVTTERTNRNKRLKALGNGIVPRCIPVFLGVVNGTGK